MIVCEPHDPACRPAYFVLVRWAEGRVAAVRDFRHAAYAIDGAQVLGLE